MGHDGIYRPDVGNASVGWTGLGEGWDSDASKHGAARDPRPLPQHTRIESGSLSDARLCAENRAGHASSGAIRCSRSASCAIVTFWHASTRDPGGAPGGGFGNLHEIRVAGSAFFILGFAATSEYAVT